MARRRPSRARCKRDCTWTGERPISSARRKIPEFGADMNLLNRFGAACAAALVLLAPALWNGFPLLQYDTGGYIARWYEGTLEQGASLRLARNRLWIRLGAPWTVDLRLDDKPLALQSSSSPVNVLVTRTGVTAA